MIPITTMARRNVAVFGLGGSGRATAEALCRGGARVAGWDDQPAARAAAERAGVELVDLEKLDDWRMFSALVLAPGVPLTHPEPHWAVNKAQTAKVPVIGDVELFCRERTRRAPGCPFIAITGTNGKSTTAALLAHLLRCDHRDVQLGGNIGTPILALEPLRPGRFYVIELSSYQIDLTPSLAPTVGVLLNITPDHLDRHGTIENYAAIKEQLVAAADQPCIGVDDDYTRAAAARIRQHRFVHAFSTAVDLAEGYHPVDGRLCYDAQDMHEVLVDTASMRTLRGSHNVQNALAALAALGALGGKLAPARWNPFMKSDPSLRRRLFESEDDYATRQSLPRGRYLADPAIAQRRRQALQAAFDSFPGLPHRLEEVGRLGKVVFVNDSKATNADSAQMALACWPGGIFWIVGGRAKAGGIEQLNAEFDRVVKAYLIGESSVDFATALDGRVAYEHAGSLQAAVTAAARDAAASTAEEPVVLLSPACASFDQYPNFEVRGDAFRAAVSALDGVTMRARGD